MAKNRESRVEGRGSRVGGSKVGLEASRVKGRRSTVEARVSSARPPPHPLLTPPQLQNKPQVRFAHTVKNEAWLYEARVTMYDQAKECKHVVYVQLLVTSTKAFLMPRSGFKTYACDGRPG